MTPERDGPATNVAIVRRSDGSDGSDSGTGTEQPSEVEGKLVGAEMTGELGEQVASSAQGGENVTVGPCRRLRLTRERHRPGGGPIQHRATATTVAGWRRRPVEPGIKPVLSQLLAQRVLTRPGPIGPLRGRSSG